MILKENQLPSYTQELRTITKTDFGKYSVITDDVVIDGFPDHFLEWGQEVSQLMHLLQDTVLHLTSRCA